MGIRKTSYFCIELIFVIITSLYYIKYSDTGFKRKYFGHPIINHYRNMKNAQEHLISKGIHPSHQRVAIMDYLLKHRTHPNVDEIYNALNASMPTLSKTTIYNTLKLFEENGAVCSISIDEKHTRYDAYTSLHAHFQCQKCGTIYDLDLAQPPTLSDETKSEFTILDTQIYYKGICSKCKTQEK